MDKLITILVLLTYFSFMAILVYELIITFGLSLLSISIAIFSFTLFTPIILHLMFD